MFTDKIEIQLAYVDNEHVDLHNMSVKSLESFFSIFNFP
jgi:hypothetical protein